MKPLLFILLVGLSASLCTTHAQQGSRVVPVDFVLQEARYDDQGQLTGHFPIANVFIQIRPDQWQAGSASKTGHSEISGSVSRMKSLITEVPGTKPPGTAYGHLELVGNQPWGTEEKYFLWQHGYASSRHDQPFEVERHQPSKVTLIPIAYRDDYFNRAVLTFQAPGDASRRYFSSLVDHAMLDVNLTPAGEPLASNFAARKQRAIQDAAAYWGVQPEKITQGFEKWQQVVAAAPPAQKEDKILAAAYAGNLAQAVELSTAFAASIPESLKASATSLQSRLNLALGRDLVDRARGRIPATGSRQDMLEDARQAFQSATQGFARIAEQTPPDSVPNQTKKSLERLLQQWQNTTTPPPANQRVLVSPP